MKTLKKQSRRDFIKVCSLSAGGLFLAAYVPIGCADSNQNGNLDPNILSPSAYLKIDSKGVVTVIVHRTEMGQGVQTALPMIVAEELQVNWEEIRIEQADADEKYGSQTTGGSWSIRLSFDPFRVAGATAREMIITAAAAKWGLSVSDCYAENGFVISKINGNKFSYGELVTDAAKLPVPQNVKLKDPKDYKIIGQRVKRLDTPAKLYGTAKFGIDIFVPGMVYAAVKRSPTFEGKIKSFDRSKAKTVNGVLDVVQIKSGVAVVADSTWNSFEGKNAVDVQWDLGPHTNVNNESIRNSLMEKIETSGTEVEKIGNPDSVIEDTLTSIDAVYEMPFLAHAPMEPVNCVADVKQNKAEIWAPTQNPQGLQRAIANLLGFKNEDVIVHVTLLGGGFGRKSHSDFGLEAAEISRAIGKPVKLLWTREDDMKHGQFRPASMHKLTGAVDKNGKAVLFSHHVIMPSIRAQLSGNAPKDPGDFDIVDGTRNLPYSIPNIKISATNVFTPVPLWYWRAVYNSQNPFVVESFIDELAAVAKKDPIDFRLEMMDQESRLTNVLKLVQEKSGWNRKLPEGSGRGVAVAACYGSFSAQVAEVTVKNNRIKLDRFVCAIDCGIVINPDTVEAQMEGAIVFAITAALKGEIIIRNGGVASSNYDDYPIMDYSEMPTVETYIVQNDLPVGGVGEVGIAASTPAFINAIFNATGKRIRKLPVKLV
ncbi:MAG: xanthine dehydrogenase family protein molybdopterin-binding subunit [Ignavibacterium sp.]|nr:xanthine dehydrogenase family protein molybdopterin-binding subunit [Ignavibacterium sp.]